ncbi:homeobox domain-containing protein [Gongronella butleri]|nr:homeobox domain-containing protein [Gongronella butleri]
MSLPSHHDDTSKSLQYLLNPVPASKKRHHDMKQAGGRPKRKRITPEQYQVLTECFGQTDTPNYELRERLSKQLTMTNREVQVWFQNRRAKMNRLKQQQKREQEQHHQQQQAQPQQQQQAHDYYYYQQFAHQSPSSRQQLPPSPPPTGKFSDPHWSSSMSPSASSSSSLPQSPTSPRRSSLPSSPSTPVLPSHLDIPPLSPYMSPIDILATAAEYVQKCDQEKLLVNSSTLKPTSSWRPWL